MWALRITLTCERLNFSDAAGATVTDKNYVLAGSGALIIGLFLPIFSMPMVGPVNLFANGGNLAGLLLLACAAVAAGLVLRLRTQDVIWPAVAACGILAFIFIRLQWVMAQMRDSLRELEDNPFAGLAQTAMGSMQLQWGWLVLIAGAGAMVYGAWKMRDRSKSLLSFGDMLAKAVAAASVVAVLALPATGLLDSARSEGSGIANPAATEAPAALAGADFAASTRASDLEASYIAQSLEIYDFQAKYYDSYGEGRVPGVTFKVKNNGDRTLKKVKVRVVFQDAAGRPIAEDEFYPVLVSEYSFGTNNTPLRPNYIAQQERGMFWAAKSVPSEWEPGRATATVTEIEFASEAPAASAAVPAQ